MSNTPEKLETVGSYVTLNGNSSLKFQNAGLEKSRKSWLEGEGFFEIQSTSDKQPFLVHLGEIDVLVTGTRFNAHKRPGKTSVFPGGGQCGFNTDSHR